MATLQFSCTTRRPEWRTLRTIRCSTPVPKAPFYQLSLLRTAPPSRLSFTHHTSSSPSVPIFEPSFWHTLVHSFYTYPLPPAVYPPFLLRILVILSSSHTARHNPGSSNIFTAPRTRSRRPRNRRSRLRHRGPPSSSGDPSTAQGHINRDPAALLSPIDPFRRYVRESSVCYVIYEFRVVAPCDRRPMKQF